MPFQVVKKQKRKFKKVSTSMGNIGGAHVRPSSTTLARAVGPFEGYKTMTFLYESYLRSCSAGAPASVVTVRSNSMFDYDVSGNVGNKQPLYYDSLLTASGPYRAYKVVSWKTTWFVQNTTAVPVTVFVSPPVSSTGEFDSVAEADNYPGVKRLFLGPAGSSNDSGSLTVTGHVNDVYKGYTGDVNFQAAYNSDPTSSIYGCVIIATADGTTNVSGYLGVRHEAFTELTQNDALVS